MNVKFKSITRDERTKLAPSRSRTSATSPARTCRRRPVAAATKRPVESPAVGENQTTPSSRENLSGGDALHLYLREIGQVKLLTPQEEITLARRIKRGDAAARELMIKANLRLVVKIARDYEGLGLPLLDLINEGNLGLMKGVERFDPAKGAKLSTYAAWWIKQNIKRALANQSKTIRLPIHVVDRLAHLRRAETRLHEALQRDPTDEELADELNLPVRRVTQYRLAARAPVSLDAPLSDDDSNRVAEVVADPNAEAPFSRLLQATDTDLAREVLATLTEREQAILTLRFGLKDGEQKTLEEIGEHFNLTRERIRQIQEHALKTLRSRMEERDRPGEDEAITFALAA